MAVLRYPSTQPLSVTKASCADRCVETVENLQISLIIATFVDYIVRLVKDV